MNKLPKKRCEVCKHWITGRYDGENEDENGFCMRNGNLEAGYKKYFKCNQWEECDPLRHRE